MADVPLPEFGTTHTTDEGVSIVSDNTKTSQPLVVKGKNIEVTPALREYAEKRVKKLDKFFQSREDVAVEVILSVDHGEHTAEITYHLGGLLMRGESRTKDLYASIDNASEKIERQVRRYKNRLQERTHATVRTGEPAEGAEDGDETPAVVRTKRFAVKPMDVEEAILQMELLGHDFFVFVNAESGGVNVLYRRNDGQFGLIDPIIG